MNIKATAPPGTDPSLLNGSYAIVVYEKQRKVKTIQAIVTGLLLEFPFEKDHKLIDTIIIVSSKGDKLIEIKVNDEPCHADNAITNGQS